MTPKFLLKVASIIMLVHAIAHTYGTLNWKKIDNPIQQSIISTMEKNKFHFMGKESSLAEFYEGYGISLAIVLFLFSLVYFICANIPEEVFEYSKRIVFVLSIAVLLVSITEIIYFFPLAALFSFVTGIIGIYSFILMHKAVIKSASN